MGSVVEEGTVLAKIDDSLYAAAVETSKAQLQQTVANRLSADANVLFQIPVSLLLSPKKQELIIWPMEKYLIVSSFL